MSRWQRRRRRPSEVFGLRYARLMDHPKEIYFPFFDGAFRYDCVRCGGQCCKGLGFAVGSSELVPLLVRRPVVAPFVQPAGRHASIIDLAEGCWFFTSDGRCSIEIGDGYAAKPSICRLFPFTRVYRIGQVTVVEPHLLLCPLEEGHGQGVTHASIAAELTALGEEMPNIYCHVPAALPDDWLEREREVVAQSAAFLQKEPKGTSSYLEFAAQLGDAATATALWQAWHHSFGLGPDFGEHDRGVARGMALLTPTLRAAALFTGSPPGPYPRLVTRLPGLILATGFIAALASRALGRPPTPRSIGELHKQTELVRELLSRWLRPAWLVEEPLSRIRPSPLPRELDPHYQRLCQGLQSDDPRPLGETFDQATADLEPALRFPLLRALSNEFGALRFR
jgi:hypothetical protein